MAKSFLMCAGCSDTENMFPNPKTYDDFPFPDSENFATPPTSPPPRFVCAPKAPKRKRAAKDRYSGAKKLFWWQPTPQDVNKEILLDRLQGFDVDTLRIIFTFTDFWTLLAAESCEVAHIAAVAKREIKDRLKF